MNQFLVVVDMQADFVNGALGSPAAEAIAPGVAQRIEQAREAGEVVYFTLDTHAPHYLSTQEGEKLPVLHCQAGTDGWLLDARIAAVKDDSMGLFEKPSFGSPELVEALRRHAAEGGFECGQGMTVELCGLCTDICVVVNALLIKTYLPEAKIVVQAALCAGVTQAHHEAALTVMRSCQIGVT